MTNEYERALLGAVLSGHPITGLARIVNAEDFSHPRDSTIWSVALDLDRDGIAPNPLTVKDALGNRALNLPNGPMYLTTLDCPLGTQAAYYAEKVHEGAVRRKGADIGRRLIQAETDPDIDTPRLLQYMRDWSELADTERPGLSMADILERVIGVAEHGAPACIPTPWLDINGLIGGWYPGQVVVVGARPGVGKSLFCENAATEVARRPDRRALFMSLEMGPEEITQRTLAWTSHVDLAKIQGRRPATDKDWESISRASTAMLSAHIDFECMGRQTITTLRTATADSARRARREGQTLGLVVVDYVQLMTATGKELSRQQQIGEIMRGLKSLAGEFSVCVLAAAQLNRETAKRGMPILSDLREAGDIENDADVVLLLDEEVTDDGRTQIPTGDLRVFAGKNRHGQTGMRTLRKFGHYARLYSAA
jgi:replicative DNA helicase